MTRPHPLLRHASAGLLARWVSAWRGAGRALVWLLLLSLPLQGLAGIVEHIRGVVHVHTAPSTPATGLPADMSMLLAVDLLRHSHGAARSSSSAEAAAHHHAEPGQHRHEPSDATVVEVGGPDPESEGTADSRLKRVFFDLDTPPSLALAAVGRAPPVAGQDAPSLGTETPSGGRLERPPRR